MTIFFILTGVYDCQIGFIINKKNEGDFWNCVEESRRAVGVCD
ncbi:hypothetical protein RchiOBHm_Chr5g0082591 [Rosa chinensis]|uniref:Uncharacterized protein n=1 Tax=Rosa chinensis TaxID=74649 RepID=A0A2P6QNB9_ROSCH|nr:hypothetical protein RchiOBHm_Chr5g0082591 [Rosa chinensis]